MSSTLIDRLDGISEGLGMKAPVRASTTANITLSGLQTVDGVVLVDGDSVLVKNQTDATTNGIYYASTGIWVRREDFDGARDIIEGTSVLVSEGSTNAKSQWLVTTASPIIGSTTIDFASVAAPTGGGGGGGGADTDDASTVTYTHSGTGAVARTVQARLDQEYWVEDFGAKGDGVTDDAAAIAAAIAACPAGGTVWIDAKTYLLTGSGTAIFTISKPISIKGQGIEGGTTLMVASGVPTTRDLFYVKPSPASGLRGLLFSDFLVTPQSGAVGQNVFQFDTSGDTSSYIAEVSIDRVRADSNASAGGSTVYINNGNGNNNGGGGGGGTGNVNGGTFNFTYQDGYIGGAVTITYGGDTLRFVNNIMSGPGAFQCTQVAGAADLMLEGNNCSMGGGFTFRQALKPVIVRNEFEQQVVSTQIGHTLTTSAGSLAGSTTLTFSSVPSYILVGMMVSDATNTGAIPAGTTITAKGATTLTISAAVAGPGVGNGDTIQVGGAIIDLNGSTGTIDSPVVRDNVLQSNAGIGNTVLLRLHGTTNATIGGNRIAPPTSYTPVLLTSNSVKTKFAEGNYFVGLTWGTPPAFVQDNSVSTVYPHVDVLMGGSGAAHVNGGQTVYIGPSLLDTTETNVHRPLAFGGTAKNLSVWASNAAGAGQSYTCTLHCNESGDTVLTTSISGASANSAQDLAHQVVFSQYQHWALKVVASGTAAQAQFNFCFEYHWF